LKDHNAHEREFFRTKIEDLEAEKKKISSKSTDWLSTQSQEIEITRQVNELKIQQNKIMVYDKKIENLKMKKHEIQKKKFTKSEMVVEKEKNDEDEDIVLDINIENEEEEQDEEEDKYKSTKVIFCRTDLDLLI
jgi:hypothetical protein